MSRGCPPQALGAEEHGKAQQVTQQAHGQNDGQTIEVDIASCVEISRASVTHADLLQIKEGGNNSINSLSASYDN